MSNKDEYMETISDKIRCGEPVGFLEAIAAINYQERLRREREVRRDKTLFGRLRNWWGVAIGRAMK